MINLERLGAVILLLQFKGTLPGEKSPLSKIDCKHIPGGSLVLNGRSSS